MTLRHGAIFIVVIAVFGCANGRERDIGAAYDFLQPAKTSSAGQGTDQSADKDAGLPPGTIVLNGSEAFEHDVGIVAKEQGVPFDEAHAVLSYQRDFASYAEGLLERYPDKLAAMWVEPFPAKSGHIVFVGSVPKTEAPPRADIELRAGGRISMDDQYIRVQKISETMVELGHPDSASYYDQESQRIVVKARPDATGKPVDLEAVASKATERLKAVPGLKTESRVLNAREIDLIGDYGDGDTMQPHAAGGGNWLDVGTIHRCTSGFSVRNTAATKLGVVTAGHCQSLSQLEEPNFSAFRPLTFQGKAPIQYGDSQWFTTTGTVGQFWGSDMTLYGQNQYRHTNAMQGQTVCIYGRASNSPHCNYTILNVGQCRPFGDPINAMVCGLALTNDPNHTLANGDSGGPVHFADTMYGIHNGTNATETSFTPVQGFQITLGVLVWH